ncbi:MAG TPA: hypothetical protein PK867_04195 [Pirellulales bacterium]|nr:hypothetical protein [Pirellulales bacterium]
MLAAQRWSGAYYLAGYAVECAFKACVVGRVAAAPELVFLDKKFSEKCWSHDFEALAKLADLDGTLAAELKLNVDFHKNWLLVSGWREQSRYDQKSQAEAQVLFDAVSDKQNGALKWVRAHW